MKNAFKPLMLFGAWVVFLGVNLAWAQPYPIREPLPEMQILTVDEAVVQGLIYNPGLQAARREIGIAEGDVISASLLANPDLAAVYGRERIRERDKTTGAIAHTRSHIGDFAAAQEISITGSRPVRLLMSRAQLDQAKADVANQEIGLVNNIKHSIAEMVGNSYGTAALHNKTMGVKPLMWELAKNVPDDQTRAKMSFQDTQQELLNDRQERMEVESELNDWLGFPQHTRVLIKDTLEPQPVPVSYEQLRDSIASRNLDIKTKLAALRAARYGLKLAMQQKIPDLTGSFEYIRTRENAKDVTALHHEYDYGADMLFPLFDQNTGNIRSAKAQEEMSRYDLQATQWDVESELRKLYWDLNLLRVRMRAYQYGYIDRLDKLIYEQDLVQYQSKQLAFADWESDVQRYGTDADGLISLKIQYKKTMADLEFLAGGSFTAPVQVPQETRMPEGKPKNYATGLGLKLGRGLSNILLSPIEVPASIWGNLCDRRVWGIIVGPFDGVVTGVERIGAGALDVVTSPVPWPLEGMEPASEPIWDKDPWTGSWSLRYFHPPFKNRQQYFDPAYKNESQSSEGGE